MNTIMKQYIYIGLSILVIFTSCVKKEFDEPDIINPCDVDPGLTANVTIFDIQKMYNTGNLDTINETVYTFPKDSNYILEAVIISSDEQGNLYKEMFIEDATGAIKISIDGTNLYNDFNQGQTVIIKLSGLNIEYDGNVALYVLGMGLFEDVSLGRIPVTLLSEYMLRKSCPNKELSTTTVNIGSIYDIYVGKLVKLEDVQFVGADTAGYSYADAPNLTTLNRIIENCTGASLVVRTSGYAKFAGNYVPTGKGSIIGVMGKYGSDYQLTIINADDVDMVGARCNN